MLILFKRLPHMIARPRILIATVKGRQAISKARPALPLGLPAR